MKKVLIIEDDPDIMMALEDDFFLEGYEVETAIDGRDGLKKGQNLDIDIIILDLMLPGINGIEICKELRKKNIGTPIIMLTAKSMDIDKVLGLEVGADDYVTKPFSPHELQARVKAVLRRAGDTYGIDRKQVYKNGPFILDIEKHTLSKNNELIHLTTIEFSLMELFFNSVGKVVERQKILEQVWGNDVYVTHRTVDTHIANLRRKIEDNPEAHRWIIGIRGIGYKFAVE
jgi:DNA-binding response OmpR family regulator